MASTAEHSPTQSRRFSEASLIYAEDVSYSAVVQIPDDLKVTLNFSLTS